MHAQRNVSNSSGAIPNINTTRILEKEANWRPKNDHTHSLIPLCTYLYVFMPHGMQGSEEPRDQRNLSRRPEGGGDGSGYARLWCRRGYHSKAAPSAVCIKFQVPKAIVWNNEPRSAKLSNFLVREVAISSLR